MSEAAPYGITLRRVKPGDLILPEDHNLLVDFWKVYFYHIKALCIARKVHVAAARLLTELIVLISEMRQVKLGDPVLPDDYNTHRRAAEIAVAISKLICEWNPDIAYLCTGLDSLLSQIPVVRTGDLVRSADRNALLSLLESVYKVASAILPWPGRVRVHLLPAGLGDDPWRMIEPFLKDGSIIFLPFNVPGLRGEDLKPYLDKYRLVLVNMIDTQPFYDGATETFYQVLYTTTRVGGVNVTPVRVIDKCFQYWCGDEYPALWDYMTFNVLKVPGFVPWAWNERFPTLSFAYVRHAKGAAVEIPNDGFWKSSYQMMFTLFALFSCLLGSVNELEIAYAARYTSDTPYWHECFPLDACWREICATLGWELIDRR
ncbi:MAG: hypothetical protein QW517_09460 [Thermofilaceae archaeon]